MYIAVVPNRNSPPAVLLREGWREGNKTRQRTLANLSDWPQEKIETSAVCYGMSALSLPRSCSPRRKLFRTAMSKRSWK